MYLGILIFPRDPIYYRDMLVEHYIEATFYIVITEKGPVWASKG